MTATSDHDPLCWMSSSEHAGVCFAGIDQIRADERERIAQAIEAQADDQYAEIRDDRTWWQRNADLSMCAGLRIAARIARNGGSR